VRPQAEKKDEAIVGLTLFLPYFIFRCPSCMQLHKKV
jgi:hypothetical protein